MFAETKDWKEDRVSIDLNSFNPAIGVRNIFEEKSSLSQSAHASTITHELFDEENPELFNEHKYSPEYNRLIQEFGGTHSFNRQNHLKY